MFALASATHVLVFQQFPLEGDIRCKWSVSLKRDTDIEWWRLASFPPGLPTSDRWRGDVSSFDLLRWPDAQCS